LQLVANGSAIEMASNVLTVTTPTMFVANFVPVVAFVQAPGTSLLVCLVPVREVFKQVAKKWLDVSVLGHRRTSKFAR